MRLWSTTADRSASLAEFLNGADGPSPRLCDDNALACWINKYLRPCLQQIAALMRRPSLHHAAHEAEFDKIRNPLII